VYDVLLAWQRERSIVVVGVFEPIPTGVITAQPSSSRGRLFVSTGRVPRLPQAGLPPHPAAGQTVLNPFLQVHA
jgi:hypothetical protein